MGVAISVDLRGRFSAVRNQGGRPTCIAFAASDTHSFAGEMTDHLSVEYAFCYAAQRRKPTNPKQGISMPLIISAIKEDGQPLEHVWPYLSALPTPLSMWSPPKNSEPMFY